jgi:hypothetical protein
MTFNANLRASIQPLPTLHAPCGAKIDVSNYRKRRSRLLREGLATC